MIYIVVWSGGYEAPSYQAFNDKSKAWTKAKEWAEQMEEGIDTINVISLDTNSLNMKRIYDLTESQINADIERYGKIADWR